MMLLTLQAEAAAAQRAFEHSRAMLEGQLSQLSSAISSQEALIATLQSNEAEAKNLGALYLVRVCGRPLALE
jgi:peptidoglycan hydrolase CwlO-like protein